MSRQAKRVTLQDISDAAGVDRSVVSRILNDDPALQVRDSTRARVRAIADQLGYRPNLAARSLRTARTGTLGIFVPPNDHPSLPAVIAGVSQAAADRGLAVVTASLKGDLTEPADYLNILGQGRVDCVLVTGAYRHQQLLSSLDQLGVPWLILSRPQPDLRRYVGPDYNAAVRLAVEHLVALGHTHFALLDSDPAHDDPMGRAQAFNEALRAANLGHLPQLALPGGVRPSDGRRMMYELLQANPRPTAVIAVESYLAFGVLRAAHEAGINVPGDISVVGINDLPFADFVSPSLTTISLPIEDVTRTAVEQLMDGDPGADVTITMSDGISLTPRESTGPPGPCA